jgi:alcohol dehydrogenase (cytochrome c)
MRRQAWQRLGACALGLSALLLGPLRAGVATRDVTTDRLRTAEKEPENWLTYGGTYRAWRYGALDQITPANVKKLQAAWAFQTGVNDNGLQSTPLVADGVMYLIGSGNRVFALDAATGRRLWAYFYETTPVPGATASPVRLPAPTNRGVALGHGHVYFGTQDNYVVALDVATGKEVWRTHVEDAQEFGCRINSAPLVAGDLVVVGSTGGDAAHRGHLVAFDGATGKARWRFNVIPAPGEKGNDTWEGDSWKLGGGAPWLTGSYDPDLDLIYWGTGNASSDFFGDIRKGDNLYTASIVALRPTTGEVAWHFQTVPHDVWDYDAAYECILVDLLVDGQPRKLLIHPSKSGYTFVLDRTNGAFVTGWKYIDTLTWSTGLDAKGVPTGRKEPVLNTPTIICPNYYGGRSFNQASYSPKTGLLYNIGIEWCGEYIARNQEPAQGRSWMGGSIKLVPPPSGKVITHLDAFEPLTGKRIWRHEEKYPLLAALVSTAGDLVFTGDVEGDFFALNAKTGERLWSFATGSGNRGGPITYAVNGKQYVATPSGFGSIVGVGMGQLFPETRTFPSGSTLFAFTLPEGTR